jgi:DNA polymerase III delta prime subunit
VPGHEPATLDGAGKKGPLYRHLGDHPDLLWVERGADDTRVRIGQIRALQSALRLRSHEGGWRAAVVADAEWLNAEAQNALLRTLEEPPSRTVLVLVAATPASLLATVRSRCQRVVLRPPDVDPWLAADAPPELVALRERLVRAGTLDLAALLDLAEEFRGARAEAALATQALLDVGCALLRERVRQGVAAGRADLRAELDAFDTLRDARRSLVRFNANPQMVAERALLALRGALA